MTVTTSTKHYLRVFFSLILLGSVFSTGIADEFDPDSPYFEINSAQGFPLESTDIKATLSGTIALVTLTQKYKNQNPDPIEARYIFPASSNAAVHEATLKVGDKKIEAKLHEKQQARKIYRDAVTQGRTASLLSQQRPNVFSQQIGNIMPGETVEVALTYSQELERIDSTYRFVVPAIVGPRYTGEGKANDLLKSVSYTSNNITTNQTTTIQLTIEGKQVKDITSPSHSVRSSKSDKNQLVEYKGQQLLKDFVLSYKLEGEEISSAVMLHRGKQENFFLLSIQPPSEISDKDILPREYQFIVDISGSMRGFPLTISKDLIRSMLKSLKPFDMFNIHFFSGGTRSLSPHALQATPENIKSALATLDQTNSGGGTKLLNALRNVITQNGHSSSSHARSVILLTDGYVSVEKEAFSLIRQNLGEANFFSFGIGSSVNRYLIEGLAHIGHGVPFVVMNNSEVGLVTKQFFDILTTPVLHNIDIAFNGISVDAVEPKSIPTMFKHKPLYVYGKWQGEPKGVITIKGDYAGGKYEETLHISEKTSVYNPALRYLWARKRLQLLDDYSKNGINQKEKMTKLALKYSLLSDYTSFVAVSEQTRNFSATPPKKIQQPLPIPSGSFGTQISSSVGGYATKANYNDQRMAEESDVMISYLMGSLGSLIMIGLGLTSLLLAALGSKETRKIRFFLSALAALGAIGTFLLRSLVSTWFNDQALIQN